MLRSLSRSVQRQPLRRLALALLLPGCAVGPDYHGPPSDRAPAAFKNAALDARWKPAEPADARARGAWWSVFHDSALDQYESRALAGNQDLKVAAARIGQARAQARVAAADLYPQASASASALRQRTTNTGPIQKARFLGQSPFGAAGAGAAGAIPGGAASAPSAAASSSSGAANSGALATQPLSNTFSLFRAPLTLDWELDLFGRVRRGYEAARAEAQSAQATYENVSLSLSANVAVNYFALRGLDAEMDVLARTLKARHEELRIAQERLAAGLTSELDAVRAQADLAGNEADLQALQRTRAQVENALATLLGEPASTLRLTPHPLDLHSAPPRLPAGVPSRMLERRPDVAAAERSLAAATARIGVARAAFFPRLSLTGEAGFESADLAQLFNWESRVWQIAANAAQPLFQGGRNVANLAISSARLQEATAQYRGEVLRAFQEVENALSDLRTLAAQAEAQERGTVAARRALLIAQQQYTRGAANFLVVLDAQRVLLADERVAAQLSSQRLQATVNLIKALGGDWR